MTTVDRLIEIFHGAKLQPAGEERDRYVADCCRNDPALEAQVQSLIQAEDSAGDFLQRTLKAPQGPMSERAGERVGNYKLLQQLGEGGFGIVWMAEQVEPVSRRVALKIIKVGMDTREVMLRFEGERQALAMMDHPHIAKVFEAGATDSGRPFFAMELVRGIPITQFCDEHRLSTRNRLTLFADVCSAVNHAHQKGIIHRDLKPSNVMVSMHDDKPVVKVIDFGIAKATQGRLTEHTLFTRFEQFVGTPAYMSPEQAGMSGLDVDTRSDIYSLGILLYELLTGQPPFDAKSLVSAGYDEMRRIIREVEPPKPSSRLSTAGGAERTTLARARMVAPNQLGRLVQPDLDWIVMKAIEKDRTRRYETANGMALDIVRFLADEPVSATPPSALYRFRKFARRNRTAIRVAALVAALLVTATAVSTRQAVRAVRAEALAMERLAEVEAERDEKERQRRDAQRAQEESALIAGFLQEVFQSPDPDRDGRTITVAEALDNAVRKLESELGEHPERRAHLRATLGVTYRGLGLLDRAIPLHEQSRDAFLAIRGADHRSTIAAMHNLAIAYAESGRIEQALALDEEALSRSRKAHGEEDPLTIAVMTTLAATYLDADRTEEALRLSEELRALLLRVRGREHPDTIGAMVNVANAMAAAGRREEARMLREETLKLSSDVLGPQHTITLLALGNAAKSHREDDPGRELEMLEKALALSREVHGREHQETLRLAANLATTYRRHGRGAEAIALREELLPQMRRRLSPNAEPTTNLMVDLGDSYLEANRLEDAVPLLEEALLLARDARGEEHMATIRAMHGLARARYADDRRDEALELREKALEITRRISGDDTREALNAMEQVGYSYLTMGRWEDGIELWDEISALSAKLEGPESPGTLGAITNLASAHFAAGNLDAAIELQEKAMKGFRRALPPGDPSLATPLGNLFAYLEGDDQTERSDAIRKEIEDSGLPLPERLPPTRQVAAILVPLGSDWKWLHPTDGTDPEEQTPGFHESFFLPDFDDSSWNSGRDGGQAVGGFGYGASAAWTDIGLPRNPDHRHCAYFRHAFTTDRVHTHLELRCRRDDGIVVYLDGVEVARDNMPPGVDRYRLTAVIPQGSGNDAVVHRLPIPGALKPGPHVLAISVHNCRAPSSDLKLGGISLVAMEEPEAKP